MSGGLHAYEKIEPPLLHSGSAPTCHLHKSDPRPLGSCAWAPLAFLRRLPRFEHEALGPHSVLHFLQGLLFCWSKVPTQRDKFRYLRVPPGPDPEEARSPRPQSAPERYFFPGPAPTRPKRERLFHLRAYGSRPRNRPNPTLPGSRTRGSWPQRPLLSFFSKRSVVSFPASRSASHLLPGIRRDRNCRCAIHGSSCRRFELRS